MFEIISVVCVVCCWVESRGCFKDRTAAKEEGADGLLRALDICVWV